MWLSSNQIYLPIQKPTQNATKSKKTGRYRKAKNLLLQMSTTKMTMKHNRSNTGSKKNCKI